jgi:Zn-dependent protease
LANGISQQSGTTSRGTRARRPRGVLGGGTWSLGRVSGIELSIDHSWLLIFALISFSLSRTFAEEHATWGEVEVWLAALLAAVLFFASILLHELGHSLTAMRLVIRVRSITLFIFGGLARLDSEPKRPRDEVLIAMAGPLVSVGLGVLFSVAAAALPASSLPAQLVGSVCSWLGTINVVLAAFNAVPGFPLDGGRVLRGVAWAITGSFERATGIAAISGAAFAWSLMGFGALAALLAGQLLGGLWMVFIGWFLLNAARSTVGQVMLERILGRFRVREVMEPARGAYLSGSESVEEVVREALLRRGLRTFFVIGPHDELRGLLSLRELVAVPPERREATPVREIMLPLEQLTTLSPSETGWNALEKMTAQRVNQLPVVDRECLAGVITREQLLNLVQAAMALGLERTPQGSGRSLG